MNRTCQHSGQQWQERVHIVRSQAHAQTLTRHLEERLAKAEAALLALTPAVGRGKRQIKEEAVLQSGAESVLRAYHVEGLLTWTFEQEVVEHIRYQMTAVHRDQGAITAQMATLGWRAYATNAPEQRLSLVQAQILQLLGLPADLYACLTYEIPQTAFPLRK